MKNNFYLKILFSSFFLISFCLYANAQKSIIYNTTEDILSIGENVLIYEDSVGNLSINDIVDKIFTPSKSKVPNLGISKSTFWIKIPVINKSKSKQLLLELSLAIIDSLEFYSQSNNGEFQIIKTGDAYSFKQRKYKDPNYLFDLDFSNNKSKSFYLKIKGNEAIQLPLKITTKKNIFEQIKTRDILSGLYIGIMLVMILYNLFVYTTVRDKSYLYYVIYIGFIILTQTSLQGYTYQYLWPNNLFLSKYSLIIFPSFAAISGLIFMNVFLKTKEYSTRLIKFSYGLITPYILAFIIAFLGEIGLSQVIIQMSSGVTSIFMLIVPIIILRKGYKPARYFLVAWSVFLIGVIVFILKDSEVLPFNDFTRYTMQIGSAIETVLLSFALAARINIYKQEKEDLIRNQNLILEQQVKERTLELNKTLTDLKETQSQLVDAEKMSSLGQLTAGIAHEINNPINFVSSNITPLRRDLEDIYLLIKKYDELSITDDVSEKLKEIEILKEELDFDYLKTEIPEIIKGIEDGATRTKEIVRGLRNFSHLDEAEQQKVDINEGVESTLILIKTKFNNISLKTELSSLPIIECYPSKLNQVFMNIIDNAVGAINSKNYADEKPKVLIKTYTESNSIIFKVEDNGIGMTENTQEKMFEPFFTTKDVGKGTGLGLSIAYGIVEKHLGKIEVESRLNKGTVVTVKIPIKI